MKKNNIKFFKILKTISSEALFQQKIKFENSCAPCQEELVHGIATVNASGVD
jgi:hypothetical protein